MLLGLSESFIEKVDCYRTNSYKVKQYPLQTERDPEDKMSKKCKHQDGMGWKSVVGL